MEGKLITIYGINGIGKTTQVELLVKFLQECGKQANHLKYPVYDLEPTGPFIYQYLRDPEFRVNNGISTEELQMKYVQNRKDYEGTLKKRLAAGEWIVAEDYVGTGIAWGLAWGADLEYLETINEDLYRPDLCILMHGHRFDTSIEAGHRNEMANEKISICKNFHLLLQERYGWSRVDANQSIEEVSENIISIVRNVL
jgi:dTMP kinase